MYIFSILIGFRPLKTKI